VQRQYQQYPALWRQAPWTALRTLNAGPAASTMATPTANAMATSGHAYAPKGVNCSLKGSLHQRSRHYCRCHGAEWELSTDDVSGVGLMIRQ